MADYVTLADLKHQVYAADMEDDNTLLQRLLDTAEKVVIRHTRRTAAELTEMGGGEFPSDLCHAVLMLAAHWYNQREAVSSSQQNAVPYSLQYLVDPFKRLTL